jgi:hypothetical protein
LGTISGVFVTITAFTSGGNGRDAGHDCRLANDHRAFHLDHRSYVAGNDRGITNGHAGRGFDSTRWPIGSLIH